MNQQLLLFNEFEPKLTFEIGLGFDSGMIHQSSSVSGQTAHGTASQTVFFL